MAAAHVADALAAPACESCDGNGTILADIVVNGEALLEQVTCPACAGSGEDTGVEYVGDADAWNPEFELGEAG